MSCWWWTSWFQTEHINATCNYLYVLLTYSFRSLIKSHLQTDYLKRNHYTQTKQSDSNGSRSLQQGTRSMLRMGTCLCDDAAVVSCETRRLKVHINNSTFNFYFYNGFRNILRLVGICTSALYIMKLRLLYKSVI